MSRRARGGVLVAGGGFAGGYVARLLGRRGATIVSPENFMLYTPILPEAASGTLEPRHVVVPLRQMCPHAELLLGEATGIDEERRTAQVVTPDAGSFEVEYEQLVLALGAVPRTFPVPGLAEHGLGFKDLADAINLRNRVLRELEAADAELDPAEAARHLGFVFVGAGSAGVEALAELSDLVDDALRWVDPPTCQHALRQARRLAKNLAGEPEPYGYRMLGQVATLGRYKGIADVLGIRLRGFPGWFVTRTYHLFQLPLLSRKLRVVVDWTTSLFFRRDIAELSGLGHPHRLDDGA